MSVRYEDVCPQELSDQLDEKTFATLDSIMALPNYNQASATCTLCGSANIHFRCEKHKFQMFECRDCQLLFSNPYPTKEQLNLWYNSDWKELENEFFLATFDARVKIFLKRVAVIQQYASAGKLLDVGPSIGFFIEALRREETNFAISCCDISEVCCNELKRKYPDVNVVNSDFLEMSETQKFDVITLWDTVEHIMDPNALFKKIHNMLTPNGHVFFSTPNTHSFEWLVGGDDHMQLRPPAHITLLNQHSIKILLERNGFALVDDLTPNASIDISYVKSLIQRGVVQTDRLGPFLQERLLDPDFTQLLETYLVDKRMGGNIVTVARRC